MILKKCEYVHAEDETAPIQVPHFFFFIKVKEKTLKEKDSMVLNNGFFHSKGSFGHCTFLLSVFYAASSWGWTATQIRQPKVLLF